jgi:hypothetical protein
MAEVLGRVERLALTGVGPQQIVGQPQVKFLTYKYLSKHLFFSRIQLALHRVYLRMLLEFKI